MPVVPSEQWGQLSANALAFVGDAVFALFIRERLTRRSPGTAHKLHTLSTRYVKASEQARIALSLMNGLEEDEHAVFMRGRNAKTVTMPKNAEMQDYRHATGFEAVLGFLQLSGRTERLNELLEQSAAIIEAGQPDGVRNK
jgi:ribonuclease-3 family protein